jgi:hypothetical protein
VEAASIDTADLADDAVTNDKLADNAADTDQIAASAVTTAKLAWVPTHYVVTQGTHTFTGAGASDVEAISPGVAFTTADKLVVTYISIANNVYIKGAEITGADEITFAWSAAAGAVEVDYVILRAMP